MTYEKAQEFFNNHKDLINSVCWDISRKTGYEFQELRSEASLIFMKTCAKWDPKEGAFSTCLTWMLKGHLHNFIKKMWKGGFTQETVVEEITERTAFHKLQLKEEINCLSKEAQDVCHIVLTCPSEILGIAPNTPPKMIRGALVRHLREKGVSRPRAWACLNEIKDMMKEIA